jgi:hypothetical protein
MTAKNLIGQQKCDDQDKIIRASICDNGASDQKIFIEQNC